METMKLDNLEDVKTKLVMMTNEERKRFINFLLDADDLRFKLIELAELKERTKQLKKEIEEQKPLLVEALKLTNLKDFEITDGIAINHRSGYSYYTVAYSDIEKKYPHLLDEMQDIVKSVTRSDTLVTKVTDERTT